MPSILFYSPFDQRSRDTESIMIAFRQQGHQVFSLSQQEGYLINDFLNANGVRASSYVLQGARSGWWYYFRHLVYFIRFTWKNKIDIVYSHLEPANFVTSIGQYFIKAKTYVCRHHIDEGHLYRFDKDLYYQITYKLARRIIVVSNRAKQYMIEKEKISARRILQINLAYDFKLYGKPGEQKVREIRSQFNSEILLLAACRLTAYKRPDVTIKTAKRLIDLGLDVKLVLLGRGEMNDQLQALIEELSMGDRVFMPGHVSNVLEYMKAADFFLHPSLLDSSCVAIKEAGLVKLPVIVCNGVGDFEDYIVHEENGFLVNPGNYVEESALIVKQTYRKKDILEKIGENLEKSVLEHFSIEKIIHQYDFLNKR